MLTNNFFSEYIISSFIIQIEQVKNLYFQVTFAE